MPGRPMTEEQKRKKRERERERQNGTPVIAQNVMEEVTPKILFLDTKPRECIFLKGGLVVDSFVQE